MRVTGSQNVMPVKTLLKYRTMSLKRNKVGHNSIKRRVTVNPDANLCIVLLYARTQNRKVPKRTRRNKYIQLLAAVGSLSSEFVMAQ
jgi:hypothetical protein